ncbi:MAG TPA: hypothetical protein VIV83_07525 [Gemmatimonadales bacterium]|jgi:hypothetical protein
MSNVEAARAALEAVKAKQNAIDNELFDLGREEQRLQDAHGAAIALGEDSDASRAQLDSVRSAIEDKKLGRKYLDVAVGQASANYNTAVREAAEATIAESGAVLKRWADSLDLLLLHVLEHRAMIVEAGVRMAAAAQSVNDSNPSRFAKAKDLVSDTIRAVADGKLDVPFSLLIASNIPEAL